MQFVLNTLILLFDEYLKNFKSNHSSLARRSAVTRVNFVKFSLQDANVIRVELDSCDGIEDYTKYLSKSKVESEKSQFDLYTEKKMLVLNTDIDILGFWSKISIRYYELSL